MKIWKCDYIFWSQASKEENLWGENPRGLHRGACRWMWGEISQTLDVLCIVYCGTRNIMMCQITEGQMVYFWLSPPSRWLFLRLGDGVTFVKSVDFLLHLGDGGDRLQDQHDRETAQRRQGGCDHLWNYHILICLTTQITGGRGDIHGAQLHNDPYKHHRDQDGSQLCQHDQGLISVRLLFGKFHSGCLST